MKTNRNGNKSQPNTYYPSYFSLSLARSNPRVCLRIRVIPRKPIPIPLITPLLHLTRIPNHTLNFALALQKLHTEPLRSMERNMAVHDPGARVIRGERNQHVAVAGQRSGVATGWVVEVEAGGAAVPDAGAAADDVVTVGVFWLDFKLGGGKRLGVQTRWVMLACCCWRGGV